MSSKSPFNCPQGEFIPVEAASSPRQSHSKKRGIPKSLRNLPPHLLLKCQDYGNHLASNTTCQQDIAPPANELTKESQCLSNESSLSGAVCDDKITYGKEEEECMLKPSLQMNEAYSSGDRQKSPTVFTNHVTDKFQSVVDSKSMSSVNDSFSDLIVHEHNEERNTGKDFNTSEQSAIYIAETKNFSNENVNSFDDNIDILSTEENEQDRSNESNEIEPRKNVIRYTTCQLREMNPNKNNVPMRVEDLLEPVEALEQIQGHFKFIYIYGDKKFDNSLNDRSLLFKQKKIMEMEDGADIIVFFGDKNSNNNFKTIEHLDSFSKISNGFNGEESIGISNIDGRDHITSQKQTTCDMLGTSGGSLKDIGHELLFSHMTESTESSINTEGGSEIWHDDNQANFSINDAMDLDFKENVGLGKRKGKKNKWKYKPLDLFGDSNSIPAGSGPDCEEEEFSEEALKMYEELERGELGREPVETFDLENIARSRFGGTSVSAPKRSSLFADAHKLYQPDKPRKPWCPGQRKCTRCGSQEHTVETCEDDGASLYK